MSGDFLARWSRRKRAAAEPEGKAPSPPSDAGDPAQAAEARPGDAPIVPLPILEELTPDSDVTAFLQHGVPASLRNAALRRMWSLDPAIRDYVGDARDYAWDWNVPGGVPGTGPLSVEQASGALRDMWRSLGGEPGAAEPERIAGVETPQPEEAGSPQSAAPIAEAGRSDAGRDAPDPPLVESAPPGPMRPPESRPMADLQESKTAALPPVVDPHGAPLRRHGRARPV